MARCGSTTTTWASYRFSFFFNDTATTEIYTLSLHDALPIFASEADDPAWSYESALNTYRRIEDWHGVPDPKYRRTGGPVFVQPVPNPSPIALAMLERTRSVGIPTFENQNGSMMETARASSIVDVRLRDGKRHSEFR